MHLIFPFAMAALLGSCHAPTPKRAQAPSATHGDIEPDYTIKVLDIKSDQFLMGKDGPMEGALKVKAGDVVTVRVTVWNRKQPQRVMMKVRPIEYPASPDPADWQYHKDAIKAIPGGYEILDVKGLEKEIDGGEERVVAIKIKFNSDQWQDLNLIFYTIPDAPLEDHLSQDGAAISANCPARLAQHEWAMGRAKNPWPDRKP